MGYYGADVSPADYDPTKDYLMTVLDRGASLDVTIAEVGNPANNVSVTGIDVSGYARAGDNIGVGLTAATSVGGIEEITITDGPQMGTEGFEWLTVPITFVDPGDGNASITDNDCRADRATNLADLDDDCDVDLFDFSLFASQWLKCTLPNVPGCE